MADQAEIIEYVLREKKRLERSGHLHWFHWGIVIASLVLTFGVWYFTKTQIETKIRNQFDREALRVVEMIDERMHKYEDALWSGVAAIHSQSHGIDNEEWKRFAETLRIETRYPGINGIGVIYDIDPKLVDVFLEEQRKTRPDFKIHPAHDEKECLPITYIEPVEANAAAVGLDMAHEANRYKAMINAKNTGVAQITGPITLVQDAAKTPGFLFHAPFYDGSVETLEDRQQNFVGTVYAPFIFNRLLEGTLQSERRHVGIKVSDGGSVLFDENHVGEVDFDPNPIFKSYETVELYGRRWDFEIWSKLSFRKATSTSKPWLVLAGGLTIDGMLLALFIFLARSNRHALKFAHSMAEAQQIDATMLESIIENAADGLITIDADGHIESYNKACEEIFGYASNEIIGKNAQILIPNLYDNDGGQKIMGARQEIEGKRKDGTIFPLDLSMNEIHLDGRKIYSAILRDISDRKKAEDEIMRSNEELERFAYIASHDLQEPLRMVNNFTQLLEAEYKEQLDDQAQKYMHFITDGAQRMQNLILDLLEYSRIGHEEAGSSDVDTALHTKLAIENLQEIVNDTRAVITTGDLPVVQVNPVRFVRLMQNLIGNSIKYRDKDREPEITIEAKDNGEEWLFSVTDNGIGMKEDYLEQIFVIFKRLHGKSEYQGTGIGLAICKKIVESFDGRIWAESEPEKGSVFYFTIPKVESERRVS